MSSFSIVDYGKLPIRNHWSLEPQDWIECFMVLGLDELFEVYVSNQALLWLASSFYSLFTIIFWIISLFANITVHPHNTLPANKDSICHQNNHKVEQYFDGSSKTEFQFL